MARRAPERGLCKRRCLVAAIVSVYEETFAFFDRLATLSERLTVVKVASSDAVLDDDSEKNDGNRTSEQTVARSSVVDGDIVNLPREELDDDVRQNTSVQPRDIDGIAEEVCSKRASTDDDDKTLQQERHDREDDRESEDDSKVAPVVGDDLGSKRSRQNECSNDETKRTSKEGDTDEVDEEAEESCYQTASERDQQHSPPLELGSVHSQYQPQDDEDDDESDGSECRLSSEFAIETVLEPFSATFIVQ